MGERMKEHMKASDKTQKNGGIGRRIYWQMSFNLISSSSSKFYFQQNTTIKQ